MMTFLVVFLMFLVGTFIGLLLPHYMTKIVMERDKNKNMELLMPTAVDYYRLCIGGHSWIEALSVNENNEYININVCSSCGFIPSKHLMASELGLKSIIVNNQENKLEQRLSKDFEDQENEHLTAILKDEMEKGLTYDKINRIYHAGQTSRKRYIIYKIARSEELRREPKDT